MSEWISVKDRLPVERSDMGNVKYKTVEVIVHEPDGSVFCCEFIAGNTIDFWSEFSDNAIPTHWMPMPEPPKEA